MKTYLLTATFLVSSIIPTFAFAIFEGREPREPRSWSQIDRKNEEPKAEASQAPEAQAGSVTRANNDESAYKEEYQPERLRQEQAQIAAEAQVKKEEEEQKKKEQESGWSRREPRIFGKAGL